MKINVNKQVSILLGVAAAFSLIVFTGCGHSNGTNMSPDEYKKAVAGSPMTPAMQAAMQAGMRKQQAQAAARQATTPRGPVRATGQ